MGNANARAGVTVITVLVLLAGLLAAPADAQRRRGERQMQGSYQMPALVIAGACGQQDAIGCVTFPTARGEKWITQLEITDQHGFPVYAELAQNLTGDNFTETGLGTVCGELEEPIEFNPGYEIYVWILTPPQDPTCLPGQGTNGTVDITVSTRNVGGPGTHHVTMEGGPLFYTWTFQPDDIEIARRDRVLWTNESDASHHVTFYDGPIERTLHASPGETVRQRFPRPGVYLYRCDLPYHSEMIGDSCVGMCGRITVDD
jgi:plastocyanin